MDFIIEKLLFTYPGAFISLFFGVNELRKTIKNPSSNYDYESVYIIRGVLGSISFILVGLIIIFYKLKGEI